VRAARKYDFSSGSTRLVALATAHPAPQILELAVGHDAYGGQHRCGQPFDMAASAFDLHEVARAEVRYPRVVEGSHRVAGLPVCSQSLADHARQ
jgi:hypothetical protein